MGKAKRKAQLRYPQIVKEHGLQEQWNSRRLEVVEGQDEENPTRTVERLRVKETYNSLKMITDYQKKLALRYALLVERADGATPDTFANVNLCSVRRNIWEPTHAQFMAYESLLKIRKSVGSYMSDILDLIIMKNMDCAQIAECKGFSAYYVAGVVMSAFIKLEEAFEEVDNVIAR
ncbi:unnamed protein product [Commensalibacter communis]|uniref:hypothetical protein n=1 Tax=Commensalibacter communis TaxID=2972786 RepID=UPI0022FF84C2|nr:hypothetical protein [Commensalibacter communis]CAI3953942.1 unnamed protein product [Commensalibacter communis]CAI3958900.1 unnamed protein product [Commensalibacter communis]